MRSPTLAGMWPHIMKLPKSLLRPSSARGLCPWRQSRCILLWRLGDEQVQEHFNTQKYPGRDQVRAVAQGLFAGPAKVPEIAMRAGVPSKKAQVVLAMLEAPRGPS